MKMKRKQTPNMINSEVVFSDKMPYYIHKSVLSKTFELHHHDFFEIDIIISGNGESNINGKSYALQKGDIVFISPSDHHNYVMAESTAMKFINIAFPMGVISTQAMNVLTTDLKVIRMKEDEYECVTKVFDFVAKKYDENSYDCMLLMKASIEWLIVFLSYSLEKNPANKSQNADFSRVLIYINNNFSQENLNRASVANAIHMSPIHFSKKFHKVVGISFQDYLLNTRLNYASTMLKMTNMTVAEIADLSGFGSDSYFSKIFKKRFGISPGKMRTKTKEE